MAPEALEELAPEERHQVYRMLRLRVAVRIGGALEVNGMFGERTRFVVRKCGSRRYRDEEARRSVAEERHPAGGRRLHGQLGARLSMSALLMAIFIRGMEYEETLALTRAMAESGARHSFPGCVDKHSTGGVGDKISLTSLPIVAACGAPVAKLSGRGLGTTGGTIDKLESIPSFSSNLPKKKMKEQVEKIGLFIAEAGDLAPADKAIYALRDTTGTVDSLPLIGSSIVSKKVATGADHLLYDVKSGSGAFLKTPEEARALAELLVRLSRSLGIEASALITSMDEPLGNAVGNALEVRESVRLLRGDPSPQTSPRCPAPSQHVSSRSRPPSSGRCGRESDLHRRSLREVHPVRRGTGWRLRSSREPSGLERDTRNTRPTSGPRRARRRPGRR
jgi:hypothetical protein